MGAWGIGPFDNDSALDAAGQLTTTEGVRKILMLDEDYCVFAAAEVIALARAGASSDEYVPDEVTKALAADAYSFTDEDVALAAQRLKEICLDYKKLDCWNDAEERYEVVHRTLAALS